ncbi:hypothetical protein Tco_1267937 [Tanacetum coccineum]
MANLELCDTHNMVAYLLKLEGSEDFHQIVDFLITSHINYALTENPTIHVSLIKQFWQTASASTSESREMKITVTIDGRVKPVTEASIRRHLKLEDYDGISTLPSTEIFKQLALIGRAATLPYDSHLLRVHSLRSDEGSLTLHALMVLCTTLSKKVESLESDLKQTKLTYGTVFTKLIMKVKRLEKEVKLNKARKRAKIVVSEDEDAKKILLNMGGGRFKDETDTQVSAHREAHSQRSQPKDQLGVFSTAKILADVARVQTYSRRRRIVSTGSGGISSAEESVCIAGASMQLVLLLKIRQEIAGYEAAIRLREQLDEEESHRITRDAEVAQRLQEDIDASERQRMAQVHQAAQGFIDAESSLGEDC